MQPIYLSADDENLNVARLLFLADGADVPSGAAHFERVFYIFDGHNDNELVKARNTWKMFGQDDIERHYWQQNDLGKWEEKIA